ncbi:hypothetical protein [Frankia sp. AgKG'84/4]|uniref:hypothetical protein n=1 Tax=Frankia sp. AgKG'84/4 TaxID=573490 RepID=UPI00200C888F|nr:hypothetical protein [Frankia sp. AgKG'84/4]MCL9795269.1 hypothetical protein [Frankia sp. AgKG'84/4]
MAASNVPLARDQAIFAARSRLADLRRRFLGRDLPPLGSLIVRHQVAIPDGAEWPWAKVSTWPSPTVLRGRSLNDGAHPSLAHIRMGALLRIPSADVIDWAIIDARGEITEGAWTRALRSPADASG